MAECVRNNFMLNGEIKPCTTFLDVYTPGMDYIYEVFRVQEKVPLFIEDHLERFEESARLSSLELPVNRFTLLQQIKETINCNPSAPGNLKIVYYITRSGETRLFIYFSEHYYPTEIELLNGVPVCLLFGIRKNPNAKVMDTFLRNQADEWKNNKNVHEALLVNHDGYITEGSQSNVLFIKDNMLMSAPAETILEGITLKHIKAICKDNNIEVMETLIHHTKLDQVDALFLTGTSRRVLPINRVDDQMYDTVHPLLKQLRGLFEEKVKLYIENF